MTITAIIAVIISVIVNLMGAAAESADKKSRKIRNDKLLLLSIAIWDTEIMMAAIDLGYTDPQILDMLEY